MHALLSRSTLLAAVVSISLLGGSTGCDTAESETQDIQYAGAHHVIEGYGAGIFVKDGTLQFNAPSGGSLTVDTDGASQADLYFHLSGLEEGAVFASEVVGQDGQVFARLSERRHADLYEASASWPAETSATLDAIQNGHVVYSTPLTGPTAPLGVTTETPTSKHYTENGHIVYDFDRAGPDGQTTYTPPGSQATYEVSHLRVRLDGGLPTDVEAVRLIAPAGAALTMVEERIGTAQ